jgi:hypothetical protein
MAIGSKEFGSCTGEFDVSVENKNGGAWLCYGYKAEVYLVRNSGFELTANKRDSARYWQPFTQGLERLSYKTVCISLPNIQHVYKYCKCH